MMDNSTKTVLIILVGGPHHSSKLRPASIDTPLPLFEIGGKTLLSRHIRSCSENIKLSEVIFIGYYDSSIFTKLLSELQKEYKIPISYLQEMTECGTAGGLRIFKDRILNSSPDYIILHHFDIISHCIIHDMINFHIKSKSKVTVLGVKYGRNLHTNQQIKYGCLVAHEESGLVEHWAEKPEVFPTKIINGGIYILSSEILENIKDIGDRLSNQRKSLGDVLAEQVNNVPLDYIKLEQDILIPLIKQNYVYTYKYNQYWSPIKGGTQLIESLPHIISNISGESNHVYIHHSSKVAQNSSIGPNVSIGPGCCIGSGVRISNSIISSGVIINDNSYIHNTVIDSNAKIGYWCYINGTLPQLNSSDSSDKITLIGKNVGVKSEISIIDSVILPNKAVTDSLFNQILL